MLEQPVLLQCLSLFPYTGHSKPYFFLTYHRSFPWSMSSVSLPTQSQNPTLFSSKPNFEPYFLQSNSLDSKIYP